MQSLISYCIIVVLHFIGDFVLQSDKDAKCKSRSLKCLVSHTSTYIIPFVLVGICFYSFSLVTLYVLITFLAHTITDYFTSKINSKLYQSGNTHNFFIGIGADQVLHYVQLFVTYYFLSNS